MPANDDSDAGLARRLVRQPGPAALATLEPDGGPFCSYVISVPAADGAPLLLLSRLAAHSRNLAADPRASLLYVREPEAGGTALAAARLTLTGKLLQDADPANRERFLAGHPDAARYEGFADFSLYRMQIVSGHLIAGFGRIVSLGPADLLET